MGRGPHGAHLIVAGRRGRHRLHLRGADFGGRGAGFRLFADEALGARLEAIAAFSLKSDDPLPAAPTAYQRFRLVRLLAILDRLDLATTREIASSVVYPDMPAMRAAEWKGSSQRRQVQRLVAEARAMRRKGFLGLLRGRARAVPR